ncbi:hypothetical protein Tco_0167047 [Tanacetum coccineum]
MFRNVFVIGKYLLCWSLFRKVIYVFRNVFAFNAFDYLFRKVIIAIIDPWPVKLFDKNLVTLEENLKENISSGTLLVFRESSILLPTPEPPDKSLKNVVLNFYQSKKMFPLNVEDVNSFAFIIWTFLPFFTYTKASPMIFSFRSENFVFDPGIITSHNPVAVSMKVDFQTFPKDN